MKLPDTSLYTIIQLVMGMVMGGIGVSLIFGAIFINWMPPNTMLAICAIAIAAKYIADGLVQAMSAMSANVEYDDLEVPEKVMKELIH